MSWRESRGLPVGRERIDFFKYFSDIGLSVECSEYCWANRAACIQACSNQVSLITYPYFYIFVTRFLTWRYLLPNPELTNQTCLYECDQDFGVCFNSCPCQRDCPQGCAQCKSAFCQCHSGLPSPEYIECEERVLTNFLFFWYFCRFNKSLIFLKNTLCAL